MPDDPASEQVSFVPHTPPPFFLRVEFAAIGATKEEFLANLNEATVAAALPGRSWLISVEPHHGLTQIVKAGVRLLRRSPATTSDDRQTHLRVNFAVEVESEAGFWATFSEAAVAAALPAPAWLVYVHDMHLNEVVLASWRRLSAGAG